MKKLVYIAAVLLAFTMGYFLQTTTLLTAQKTLPENGETLMMHFQSVKKDAFTVVKYSCPSESYYASSTEKCCNTYYFDLGGNYLCTHDGSGLEKAKGGCSKKFNGKDCKTKLLWPFTQK